MEQAAIRARDFVTSHPPATSTHVVACGILGPTLVALAATPFGERPFRGRLPVAPARLLEDVPVR